MNIGMFGFPTGANITVDIQEFDKTGPPHNVWRKPANAKLCFIEATGGGQSGGGSAGTAGNRVGGAAGVAYQITILASNLNDEETVVIGAGGVGTTATIGTDGGDTTFSGFVWAGGTGGGGATRCPYHGVSAGAASWGSGGSTSTGLRAGCVGGFGAGGGGSSGNAAGKPRSFEFTSGASTPARGGGPTSTLSANILNDVDGFGEGGGGNGGNGRRGSGGGGVTSTLTNTAGGTGGDGFLRVITYCWE